MPSLSSVPGLLSSVGPSLFSQALVEESAPLIDYSSRTFLDGFQPDPRTGDVLISALGAFSSFRFIRQELRFDTLSSQNAADGFRRSVEGVVRDASRIMQETGEWGLPPPHPLPATEGQWTLTEFYGDPNAAKDLTRMRRHRYQVGLESSTGQLRRFSLSPKGDCSLFTGLRGKNAGVEQRVSIDGTGQVQANAYRMEFMGPAAAGLTEFLGMLGIDTYREVALVLAARIFFSRQYNSSELRQPLRIATGSHTRSLILRKGEWRYPSGLDVEELNPVRIVSKETTRGDETTGRKAPLIEVYWEELGKASEHVVVTLRSPQGRGLMPLADSLQEILWNGALNFVYR